MLNNVQFSTVLKYLFAAFISVLFVVVISFDKKIALAGSFILLLVPISLVAFFYINKLINNRVEMGVKKFLIVLLFIYPLLPTLWGVRVGIVIGAHRLSIFIMMAFLIQKGLYGRYIKDFFRTKIFTYPILFVLTSMFVSSVLSADKVKSLNSTVSFFLEMVMLAVVVFNVFKTREDISQLLTAILYSTLILSLFGLYESITLFNVWSVFGNYNAALFGEFRHAFRSGDIRIIGSFSHSIAFGCFLALSCFTVFMKYRGHFFKFTLSLGLVALTILKTQSRTAQISLLLILAIYFIFIEKKQILILLVLVLPLLIFKFDAVAYQFQTLNPFSDADETMLSSSMARVEQFHFLTGHIKKNMWIGVGNVPIPAMMRWIGNYHSTIDNFYLVYVWYYGIVGLVMWIFLMLSLIIKPFLTIGKRIFTDPLALLLIGNILAYILMNVVVALWSYHFIIWICIGILTRLIHNHIEEKKQSSE